MNEKQCKKCRYNLSDTKEVRCAVVKEKFVEIVLEEENCSMYFEKEDKNGR